MTPEISLPKEAKKIYSYDTLTEHMWFWFYKILFCRQRNNLTTTGRALAARYAALEGKSRRVRQRFYKENDMYKTGTMRRLGQAVWG